MISAFRLEWSVRRGVEIDAGAMVSKAHFVLGADGESVIRSISAMESALDKPTFLDRYRDFMALAPSHVTVFAPTLPALTALPPHAKP